MTTTPASTRPVCRSPPASGPAAALVPAAGLGAAEHSHACYGGAREAPGPAPRAIMVGAGGPRFQATAGVIRPPRETAWGLSPPGCATCRACRALQRVSRVPHGRQFDRKILR